MTPGRDQVGQILRRAKERGAATLLETEGMALLEAIGIEVPAHVFVRNSRDAASVANALQGGDRVVIKVVSPTILHKSDVGGVAIVPNTPASICAAIDAMEGRFDASQVAGFTINELVAYDAALGNELLLGFRWTEDFGPVVTIGPGGIFAEFLTANFKDGRDVAIVSPDRLGDDALALAFERVAVVGLSTGRLRGQLPRVELSALTTLVRRFAEFAAEFAPADVAECEINPLVIRNGRLVALDILVKLGRRVEPARVPRPLHKLARLLQPHSAAIVGVSEKLNPGHIIVNNLIREGFDRSRLAILKPGATEIEGCRCYPDVAALPETVDLFILAVSAAQAAEVMTEVIEQRKAESFIVIPGGLEEKRGTEGLVSRMRAALTEARNSPWQGPVINGGNCLGIRSLPGRYDTTFIPEYKLPVPGGEGSPLAIVSQSGAFVVSRMSRLGTLNPRYAISVGNQMDLTIGDYLVYLKDDPEIQVFAVYAEGFAREDGRRVLGAAAEIVSSGRVVILYRAGRTPAGAQASASHTASIAGDYAVARALARAAGVIVAETIQDFDDLTRLFTLLRDRRARGRRLGAISNAGCECVAVADNLGAFTLPPFAPVTVERLEATFRRARIDSVVDVHNPLDLTPMADDVAYGDAVSAVLEDPDVDIGVVGCVPLTPSLNTLPRGDGHAEDLESTDSIAARLIGLRRRLSKPWVAVVDAGARYDPLVQALERGGVPVFGEADRALRLFNIMCAHHLERDA